MSVAGTLLVAFIVLIVPFSDPRILPDGIWQHPEVRFIGDGSLPGANWNYCTSNGCSIGLSIIKLSGGGHKAVDISCVGSVHFRLRSLRR